MATDNVEQALQAAEDAMVDAGIPRDMARNMLVGARSQFPTVTIRGNLADLQRMGALQAEEAGGVADAFVMPAAVNPATNEPLPGSVMANPDAMVTPPGTDSRAVAPASEVGVTAPGGAQSGAAAATNEQITAQAGDGDTAGTPAGATADTGDGGLESMTKAELIDEANRRGVEVSSSWTKAEIIAELEEA